MDTELARKLLGVDGSNLLMLETAWHHRRTQILEQQIQTDNETEAAEQEALLANLDLARAVLKNAAERTSREREQTNAGDRPSPLNINKIWLDVMIGVAAGALAAVAVIVVIAWLTGHVGS